MKKIFLILIVLIVLSLITACSSSGKSEIGTVKGVAMEKDGQMGVPGGLKISNKLLLNVLLKKQFIFVIK